MFSRLFSITIFCGFVIVNTSASMNIHVNNNYYVKYQTVEINCTSSVTVENNFIAIDINDLLEANIYFKESTGKCMRFIDMKHIECSEKCKCTTDGKSIAYVYNVTTDNSTLKLKCASSNPLAKNDTVITKASGPTDVSFNVSSPFNITEGERLGPISCLAVNCTPHCTYIWTGPSGFVRNASILQINDIRRTNSGKYICTGANAYGEDFDHVIISVQYGPNNISINASSPVKVVKGKHVGPISCKADCVPDCAYTWSGPNNVINIGSLLEINSANKTDDGTYTCTGQNTYGVSSGSVDIIVQYGPSIVAINGSSPVIVIEGETLGPILCTADCVPVCTYTWISPSNVTMNGSILQIDTAHKKDGGTYICTGANDYGSSLENIDISVHYGPSALSLNPATETYTINETEKFGPVSCSADCNPPCNMTWTGPYISTLNFTSTDLSIPKIDRLNTGQFTCNAKNIIRSINTTVHVKVNYRPTNVSINASAQVYVKEGQRLGPIPCTADCVPSCIYIWSGPNNFTRNDSILQINHINRTDDGTYSCMGYNSIGYSSNDVKIKVQYGPTDVYLNPFHATYILKEGETLGPISCMANCYPVCTVTWTGRQKMSAHVTINNMSIPDINRNDSGQYICTANNSIEMNQRIVNVIVNYAAEISSVEISNTNGSNVKENTSLHFMCEAIGLPTPTVKWLFSNSEGITKNISDIYKFIIPSSACTDTGTYTCVVQNEGFSAKKSSLSLNVSCPPRFMKTCSSNNKNIIPVKRNQSIHIHACFLSNPSPLSSWIKTYGNNSFDIAESEICLFKNSSLVYTTVVKIELGEEIEVNITVLAENNIGESSKTGFRIRVEDKPFTPTDVRVSCKGTNRIQWISNFNGGSDQVFSIRYTENNETYFRSPFNVTDGGESTRHEYILDNLRPNTFYHFNVIAINRINSTESNLVSCQTSGNTSNYVAAALGTSSGLLFIIGFSVGILLYKRRIKNRGTGKEKSLIQRQAANLDDDDTDGLKDNPLYALHNETDADYCVVSKLKTGMQANGMQDNHLENNTSDIYVNQMPLMNITQSSHTTKPTMNQDGLIYADLDFMPTGSTFVIRGIENRNAYAIIDLNKSADPLPSSDDEDSKRLDE